MVVHYYYFATICNLRTYLNVICIESHHEDAVASPCRLCWSNRAGSDAVLRARSHSVASANSNTYSLCALCNLRHAFPYLSRVSSNLRPPRLVGPVRLFTKIISLQTVARSIALKRR